MAKTQEKDKVSTKKKKKGEKNINNEITNSITPRNILIASIAGLVFAIAIIIYNKNDNDDKIEESLECYCEKATAPIKSKSTFKDVNSEQLAHAKANGLKHIIKNKKEYEQQIDSLIDDNILVKIKPNKYYNIRKLTHSYPYLTPEAYDLLNLIGKRFHVNLQAEGLPKYKFQISSLLRTVEFQNQLTGQNINATRNLSAHFYGTTFDIAYNEYDLRNESYQDIRIEKVLEKTLRELREECRLLIIREKSNKCFHITVVNKKN